MNLLSCHPCSQEKQTLFTRKNVQVRHGMNFDGGLCINTQNLNLFCYKFVRLYKK
jgi:hypothetical protein